ncbi:recombinase family protein [Ensifer aridi]|uniref:recombinase family protein n=1 Tax=Ensifer aridi TaxID=1708715 RepID=UPI0015E4889C|nr:recombinase family protein [Ensifer aridi]
MRNFDMRNNKDLAGPIIPPKIVRENHLFLDEEAGRRRSGMAKYGYARVSTLEQSLDLQIQALQSAGCDEIFSDVVSGGTHPRRRPGFSAMIEKLQAGDTVAVYGFDRLSRETGDVLIVINDLHKAGIQFVSITQGLDTSTSLGEAGLSVIAIFAQFERDMISQRVKDAQKASGRAAGRKPKVTPYKLGSIRELRNKGIPTHQIAKETGLGLTTVKRYVRQLKDEGSITPAG